MGYGSSRAGRCHLASFGRVTQYLQAAPDLEAVPLAVEAAAEADLVDPTTGEGLGIRMVGIMDLVLPGDSGPCIVDFKTTSRSSEPLEICHEIQLSAYAYLFRSTSGQQESALEIRNLIKTKLPQVQFHRYQARSEQHFRRLFGVIRAYLDDLSARRFVFRPGLACAMCDVRRACCLD